MPEAIIGIGSNLGDRIENCENALDKISDLAKVSAKSSLYETEPVDKEDQPDFINCVVKIETDASPISLLLFLQSLENKMGRERGARWEKRVIDLDIIFYGDVVIKTDELFIPHPRAHLRRFVLAPLCEISPDLVHPVLKVSVSKLLADLKDEKRVVKLSRISTADSQ